MYGLKLTRQISCKLSLLLHAQERDARAGRWDEERWACCRQVWDSLAERFDLPAGYTDPDDPFADVADTIWRTVIADVRALRDAPATTLPATEAESAAEEITPMQRAEEAILNALCGATLSYNELVKVAASTGMGDEGSRLAVGRLQSRGLIGHRLEGGYALGHTFLPPAEVSE